MDALFMISEVLISPFSVIALKAKILTAFVRIKKEGEPDQPPNSGSSEQKNSSIGLTEKIKPQSFCQSLIDYYRKPKK